MTNSARMTRNRPAVEMSVVMSQMALWTADRESTVKSPPISASSASAQKNHAPCRIIAFSGQL